MATANPVVVGGFILSGLALGVAAVLLFGGTHLFSPVVHAVVYFRESVANLNVGAPVTFRGVRVGANDATHESFRRTARSRETRRDGAGLSPAALVVRLSGDADAHESPRPIVVSEPRDHGGDALVEHVRDENRPNDRTCRRLEPGDESQRRVIHFQLLMVEQPIHSK